MIIVRCKEIVRAKELRTYLLNIRSITLVLYADSGHCGTIIIFVLLAFIPNVDLF